jgi:thiamine biosynthesis lipoprotein
MKKIGYIFLAILVFASCKDNSESESKFTIIKGKTMGSSYEIAYDSSINLQERIDYYLGYYNYLMSTYDSNSIISKFNLNKNLSQSDSISFENSKWFFENLDSLCKNIHKISNGAFNPSMASLINYWGFGNNKINPESANDKIIDSLKQLHFGFKVDFLNKTPLKSDLRQTLNFNAIAPGQAVDFLAQIFDSLYHIKNYYINISGEIKVKGNNGFDSYWPIKIEKPMLNAQKAIEFCNIPLKNYGLATSGNYRQFFFKNGKRYGHSIDPRTGYPARNSMLSATILAPSAAEADAYATTCMVLGLEKSIELISKNPNLKAFFIYEKDEKQAYWASKNLSYTLASKF